MRLDRSALENHRPWAGLPPHGHPHPIMQEPTRRRMLPGVPWVIGKRRLGVFACVAEAVCYGGIAQHAQGPSPAQGHETCGRVQLPRGGQTRRVLPPAAAACRMPRAWVARPHGVWRELGVVTCVRGQAATTGLGEAGWTGGACGGEGAVARVDHRVG